MLYLLCNDQANGAEAGDAGKEIDQIHEVQTSRWFCDRGLPHNPSEPVWLDIGQNHEIIRFMIALKMMEVMILGLSWLDNWGHTIWWQKGERKMRLR